jgi:hypothetical protein
VMNTNRLISNIRHFANNRINTNFVKSTHCE